MDGPDICGTRRVLQRTNESKTHNNSLSFQEIKDFLNHLNNLDDVVALLRLQKDVQWCNTSQKRFVTYLCTSIAHVSVAGAFQTNVPTRICVSTSTQTDDPNSEKKPDNASYFPRLTCCQLCRPVLNQQPPDQASIIVDRRPYIDTFLTCQVGISLITPTPTLIPSSGNGTKCYRTY